MVEHEPHRLDWSRTEMRLTLTPSVLRSTPAGRSRSRCASRRRKSPTRRSTCGASPATQSKCSPPSPCSVHTVPRLPGRCTMRCVDAAQRHHGAVGERRRLRQPPQPRRDPAAVLLRERLGLAHAAARRHGEDHLARGGMDAQGIAARAAVPAHAHQVDVPVEHDLDRLRLALTPVEQRAQRLRARCLRSQDGVRLAAGHAGRVALSARISTRI